jgi:hypothetical protein
MLIPVNSCMKKQIEGVHMVECSLYVMIKRKMQLQYYYLGQDKSVFHQYCLQTRQWVGPNGARPLLPKSNGYGLMVSAFQSQEFGFGMTRSKLDLKIVNEH